MELLKVNKQLFDLNPGRFQLLSGEAKGAPLCPFGNKYEWIGFDKEEQNFVRFTKSVFKILVNKKEAML